MSYSNPTWYGVGNVGGFSKSFEKAFNTQFKSAFDYYDAKSKEIEEYNNNLENKAEAQRKELLKGKEITPKILADVESQVQKFLKEGRTFKEGEGFFGAPEVQKKTKAEIDKAASSFTGRIGVMNELLENAMSGKLQPKRDLDRGSATYLEYTKVMNAIKEDASNVKFDYKGNNEYDFTVTYKKEDGSSKTINSDDLKSMIELNDPEVRKLIDKNFDEASTSMLGLTKTAFSKRIAEGEIKRNPRTGVAYVPEEDVDVIVKEQVGMMKPQTVNDYFNNEIDFDDKKRLEILSKTDGGQELIDLVDKTDGNVSNEALSILLDIPEGDIKSRDAAFKKLGISAEQASEYSETLKKYRTEAVAERFKDELKSKGLQSKYFRKQEPKLYTASRRSTARGGETKAKEDINPRIGVAMRTAFMTGVNTDMSFETPKNEITPGFTPGNIRVGSETKPVIGVGFDTRTRQVSVAYSPGKGKRAVAKYDITNPYKMQDLYRDFGANKKNLDANFTEEMLKQFEGGDYSSLNTSGMDKWIDWLTSKGRKNEMLDYLGTNIDLVRRYPHWRKFYNENKKVIDKKLIDNARNNK